MLFWISSDFRKLGIPKALADKLVGTWMQGVKVQVLIRRRKANGDLDDPQMIELAESGIEVRSVLEAEFILQGDTIGDVAFRIMNKSAMMIDGSIIIPMEFNPLFESMELRIVLSVNSFSAVG